MILWRDELEEQEAKLLAPYAMKSRDSRGRKFAEDEHDYRTAYQRDRDRIIHTTAFRRLEYKTQVFIITEGDYYRTRLTHTIEVAQIGRTIARALRANEDLTEAICLAHDLHVFRVLGRLHVAKRQLLDARTVGGVKVHDRRFDPGRASGRPGLHQCANTTKGLAWLTSLLAVRFVF